MARILTGFVDFSIRKVLTFNPVCLVVVYKKKRNVQRADACRRGSNLNPYLLIG